MSGSSTITTSKHCELAPVGAQRAASRDLQQHVALDAPPRFEAPHAAPAANDVDEAGSKRRRTRFMAKPPCSKSSKTDAPITALTGPSTLARCQIYTYHMCRRSGHEQDGSQAALHHGRAEQAAQGTGGSHRQVRSRDHARAASIASSTTRSRRSGWADWKDALAPSRRHVGGLDEEIDEIRRASQSGATRVMGAETTEALQMRRCCSTPTSLIEYLRGRARTR